jgi:hypothetical protein
MPKRKRTRFVGAYTEPPAPPIDLPFSVANLRALLIEGARPGGRYTHQQIKGWAEQFWWTQAHQPFSQGAEVPPLVEEAADLAQDIARQWDMSLANAHTLQELQHLDFSQVRLPAEWFAAWFAAWLARLNELAPPTVSE